MPIKKKKYAIAAILLGLIVIFAITHVIKREELSPDLVIYIKSAEGISENIKCAIIDGASEEQIGLSITGTIIYYNRLNEYAKLIPSFAKKEEEKEFLMSSQQKLEQYYDEVSNIATKYRSEGLFTETEKEFLETVKETVDSLLSDMYQRYGRFEK